ncbi:hypothetical protein OIV83_001444 [Microbotryomycetes sp. JL201]|nr:hypothetical protein OIV83_001444 [Microbotryomycetes sp. JL201]
MASTPVHDAVARFHSTPSSAGSVVFKRRTRSQKIRSSSSTVLTPTSRRDTLILPDGPGAVLWERSPAANNKQERIFAPNVSASKASTPPAYGVRQSPAVSPNAGAQPATPASINGDKENSMLHSPPGSSKSSRQPFGQSPSRPPSRLRHVTGPSPQKKHVTDPTGFHVDADVSFNTSFESTHSASPPVRTFVAPADVMPRERMIPVGAIGYDSDELTDADAEGSFEQDLWQDDETFGEYPTGSSTPERDQELLHVFLALRVDSMTVESDYKQTWLAEEGAPEDDCESQFGLIESGTPSLTSSGFFEPARQELQSISDLLDICADDMDFVTRPLEMADCESDDSSDAKSEGSMTVHTDVEARIQESDTDSLQNLASTQSIIDARQETSVVDSVDSDECSVLTESDNVPSVITLPVEPEKSLQFGRIESDVEMMHAPSPFPVPQQKHETEGLVEALDGPAIMAPSVAYSPRTRPIDKDADPASLTETPASLPLEQLRRTSPRKVFATPTKNPSPTRTSVLTMSQRRSPRRLPESLQDEPPASVFAAPAAKRQLSKLVSKPVFAQRATATAPPLAATTLSQAVALPLIARKIPHPSLSASSRLPAPAALQSIPVKPKVVAKQPSFMRPTASVAARENVRLGSSARPSASTTTSRVPAPTTVSVRSTVVRPVIERKGLPKQGGVFGRPLATSVRSSVSNQPSRVGSKSLMPTAAAKNSLSKASLSLKRPATASTASSERSNTPVSRVPQSIKSEGAFDGEAQAEPASEGISEPTAPTEHVAVPQSIAIESAVAETPKKPASLPLLPRPAPLSLNRSPEKRSAQRATEATSLQVSLLPRPAPIEALLPRPQQSEKVLANALVPPEGSSSPSPARTRPPSPPRMLLPRPAPLDSKPSALTASADDLGASSGTEVLGLAVFGSSAVLRAARLKRTRTVTSDSDSLGADASVAAPMVASPATELLPRPVRSPRPTRRSRAFQKEGSIDSTVSDSGSADVVIAPIARDGSDYRPRVPSRSPLVLKPIPALTQDELNRLTQKNTKRNQISVNKLQVETIVMDCNRPPSPTSKIRRTLSSEGALGRPSSKEGREARAAKRRNALRSSTDGSEAALIDSELGQGGDDRTLTSHFRGAGDEEEFVSPVRTFKTVTSASARKPTSQPQTVKSVKWDRALVYEAGHAPKVEPSNDGIIKRLALDGFGNVVVPANAPVTKPIAVRIQKLVYKDDE